MTYFFNGGKEIKYPGEKHILIPSRQDIDTHDKAPKMRAKEITDKAIEETSGGIDFLLINYANADMVGHTANKKAVISAVEEVDAQLKRLVEKVLEKDGAAIVTADHGNAEVSVDPETGALYTAHTLNKVPLVLTLKNINLKDGGGLVDIAPTVLGLLDIPKPAVMTGQNLIQKLI